MFFIQKSLVYICSERDTSCIGLEPKAELALTNKHWSKPKTKRDFQSTTRKLWKSHQNWITVKPIQKPSNKCFQNSN